MPADEYIVHMANDDQPPGTLCGAPGPTRRNRSTLT